MELQNFLIEALQKRFSANATVKAIESQIEEIAENTTFNKYKNNIIYANGLEFKLNGVRANLSHYSEKYLILQKVDLHLAYFCTSKLPKPKREKLKKVKEEYEQKKRIFEWNYYKFPIWYELHYSIDIEEILSGNFKLNISLD